MMCLRRWSWFSIYYLFIPEVSYDVFVMSGEPNKLALEEGNINERGVKIDELEDKHFEGEVVIKIGLSSMHL